MKLFIILLSLFLSNCVVAFTPFLTPAATKQSNRSTQLYFGIPSFGSGKDKDNKKETNGSTSDSSVAEKKIGLSGLLQLITAGMGSPFLGEFEGVDKETGKMMFSLEANNLVDEVSCMFDR